MIYLLSFLNLMSSICLAQTAKTIHFEDLPKLVRERNDNVRAAEIIHQAQKERSGYLTRSFLPKVSATAGHEKYQIGSDPSENQGYWMVEGRVNIYRGGRDKLESEVRHSNEKIAKYEFTRDYQSELKEARRSYWKLVSVGKLIKDRKEALKANENYIKSSRRRTGAGISTNADTLQFELHRTMLQQDIKKLTLEQDLLRNRLSVAIGWDEHETINVAEDFPHPPDNKPDVPPLKPEANTSLQIAAAQEKRERARSKQGKSWWLPHVDIYSSYGVPSLSDEHVLAVRKETEWTAGVQIGIDLGAGLETRNEGRAKELEAKAERLKSKHRQREVTAADHELRHDLILLHELIHDADRDISRAETFLKLTYSEYNRGVKNGPDLLEALKGLYEFRERRTSLYREYHETQSSLLELMAHDEG